MNSRELSAKAKYEKLGWHVLRNGSPDFVALKTDISGAITEVMAIEVKSKKGKLTYEQEVYKKIFQKAGIPFIVERID